MTAELTEACVSCGRDTRSGSRLFTDRRTTRDDDGHPIYLCGDCNERAISQFGRQPTERDMVQIAARGAGFGLGGGGTMGSGGGPG
jgi:hypothetical protein